jgi:hypothetical protein
MYALDCADGGSARVQSGTSLLRASSPDISVVGDVLALPAGAGNHTLELRTVDGSSRTLRLVCLPLGFTKPDVTGEFSEWVAMNGGSYSDPRFSPFNALFDETGFPLWVRETKTFGDFRVEPTSHFATSARMVATGPFFNEPGIGFAEYAFDGTPLRTWDPQSGPGLDFHAAASMPNGHLIGILYESSEAPAALPADPSRTPQGCLDPEALPRIRGGLVEVGASGEVVHRWDFQDHLPDSARGEVVPHKDFIDVNGGCVLDYEHLNAVQYYPSADSPEAGMVLVTGRHLDGVVMLSWPSGEVLWSVGVPNSPKPLTVVDDPLGGPSHPHDGNMIDDSTLIMYDNHPGSPSRAVVYRLDFAAGTATLVESYGTTCQLAMLYSTDFAFPHGIMASSLEEIAPCSALITGSARRTSNGDSVVVGWGSANVTFSEFKVGSPTPFAEAVVHGVWSYRAIPVTPFDVANLFPELAS